MLNIIKNIKLFFKRKYTKYRVGDRVFLTSLDYPDLKYREATIQKVIGRKEILYKVMLDLYPSRYQLIPIPEYFEESEIEFIDKKMARSIKINDI
jgi:hypothetical protein